MSSWARFKIWAGVAAGVVVAALVAFAAAMRGARSDGINEVLVEQQEKRDALQQRYNQIDSQPLDADRAYDDLRRMSDDNGSHR